MTGLDDCDFFERQLMAVFDNDDTAREPSSSGEYADRDFRGYKVLDFRPVDEWS